MHKFLRFFFSTEFCQFSYLFYFLMHSIDNQTDINAYCYYTHCILSRKIYEKYIHREIS